MVLVADHAAQAGAGCGEVVFQLGDTGAESGVLGGGLLKLVGQLVVVLGEFVDAGGQVLAAEGVELLSEVTAQGGAEPVAFFAERGDLLAREFQVRAQGGRAQRSGAMTGWGLCVLSGLCGVDVFADAFGVGEPGGDAAWCGQWRCG